MVHFTSEPKCEVEGCGRRATTEVYHNGVLHKVCSSCEINIQVEQEEMKKNYRKPAWSYGSPAYEKERYEDPRWLEKLNLANQH